MMVLRLGLMNRDAVILNYFKLSAFFVLFFTSLLLNAQNPEIDSLKNVIAGLPSDTTKVNALIEISRAYMSSSLEETILFAQKARNLADSLGYNKGKALALKNIGLGYYYQSDFLNVFEYWHNSLEIYREIGDLTGVANLENNLGSIYFNQGDDATAVDYFLKSLSTAESIGDSLGMGRALNGIGIVYMNKEMTLDKAKDYFLRGLAIFTNQNYGNGIGTCAGNLGEIYHELAQYDSAIHYLEISISAFDNKVFVPHSYTLLGLVYRDMGDYSKSLKYLGIAIEQAEEQNLKMEVALAYIGLAQTEDFQKKYRSALDYFKQAEKIALEIGGDYELKDAYKGIAKVSAELGLFDEAIKYFELHDAIRDTLYNLETDEKIKGLQFTYQMEKKQNEIDLLTKDKLLQEANMKRQRLAKNAFLAGFILIIFIALIIYRNYKHKVKTNKLLDKQNQEIESLLLNILPEETAKELQQDGYATPRSYESVSVLFTDFKSFTKIAEGLKPHELIAELNSFFNSFDDIIEKYKLEKIKTIGDAYMCAGGIPVANNTHPERIVKAGLEMQDIMKKKNELRVQQGKQPWELRVGIHTGPVVAGVVGRKKYAYDIWGDTVNIASRMESNGEVGRVNISAVTYDLVKDKFECSYRGKIEAKNKGNIDMYFLEKELVAV